MQKFIIKEEGYIKLCDLVAQLGWATNAGMAKHFIAEGKVKVNGQIELRKRAKIIPGSQIEFEGQIALIE